jgi:bifunctional non-homologous end joining protein LigD
VSTPVSWPEIEETLDARDAERLTFEASDVLRRVQEHGDLYEPNLTMVQSLPSFSGTS